MQENKDSAKKLAKEIEVLAQTVQSSLDSNQDINFSISEMVKSVTTLIFVAGEIYTLEQLENKAVANTVSVANAKLAKVVKPGPNYRHKLRGAAGRFIAKGSTFVPKTNLTSVLLNPVNGQV